MNTPLRASLTPALDETRLARQWEAIKAAGLPDGGGARRRRTGGRLALALVGAVLLFVVTNPTTPEGLPSGAVVGSSDEPIAVALLDGSKVALARESQLKVVRGDGPLMEVELSTGRARFDVAKKAGRRFDVRAGGVQVRVVGTRFEVVRTRDRVDVRVEEGIVEVFRIHRGRGPGQDALAPKMVKRLRAGESVSVEASETQAATEAKAEAETQSEVNADGQARTEVEASGQAQVEVAEEPPARPARPTNRSAKRARAHRKEKPHDDRAAAGAADLFRAASLARRAGRMREAAEAYEALLRLHPKDPRATLSAFELGRIRMDMLGDHAGAVKAFEQALRSGARGGTREDALARLVAAQGQLGRARACRRVRARYLARYPDGVHAAAVKAGCK
ncbi:MAG: FecR domain-containing protein [Myxococcales bacterium]|nr:FecR domain-containing protein [Myxococcales bacterium]